MHTQRSTLATFYVLFFLSLAKSLRKEIQGPKQFLIFQTLPHHYTSLTGRLASSRSTGSGSCSWVPFLFWGSNRACRVTLEVEFLEGTAWILKLPGLAVVKDSWNLRFSKTGGLLLRVWTKVGRWVVVECEVAAAVFAGQLDSERLECSCKGEVII